MKYRLVAAAALLQVLCTLPGVSAGPDMAAGMWEITTRWEMPGMPMEMPAATFTQCLSRENGVPRLEGVSSGCTIIHAEAQGGSVAWELECTGNGQNAKGKGKVTYSNDTFTGGMTLESEGIMTTQFLSGRRIGDCN